MGNSESNNSNDSTIVITLPKLKRSAEYFEPADGLTLQDASANNSAMNSTMLKHSAEHFEPAARFAVEKENTINQNTDDHLEFEKILFAWQSTENDDYVILEAKDHSGNSKIYGAIVHEDLTTKLKTRIKFYHIIETSPGTGTSGDA